MTRSVFVNFNLLKFGYVSNKPQGDKCPCGLINKMEGLRLFNLGFTKY